MLNTRCALSLGTPCLLAAILLPLVATAAVHRVRQDGTGSYTAISEAVMAAASGDTIEVGPGEYRESIVIDKSLRVLSTMGAESTTLDGENARRLLRFVSGSSIIKGFSIVNGFVSGSGGAIRVDGGVLRIRNCTFVDNGAMFGGGAVYADGSTGLIDAIDCVFERNYAIQSGGAGYATGGRLTMTGCEFLQNSADGTGGAMACIEGIMEAFDCLFVENMGGGAGAMYYSRSFGSVQRSTFYRNGSSGGATVLIDSSPTTNVTRNILSSDLGGFGLGYVSGAGAHSCNIYWDNRAGAIDPVPLAIDELVEDPLFCAAESGEYTVRVTSPASPALSPCKLLVGSRPVGCSVPVERRTWGDMKALYRR